MTVLHAETALTPEGWRNDIAIHIDEDGLISEVLPIAEARKRGGIYSPDHQLGIVLPAAVNIHSHAFQRAMAGLTEYRGKAGSDSFWSWRVLMYHFLGQLDPDQVEAIAAFVQMEMLEAGYAGCAEFHYLHNQPDGTPYDDSAELGKRIMAAANETGIGLILLPVQYQYGGCDRRPLSGGQRRFHTTPEQYASMLGALEAALPQLPADCSLGLAPHSIRAVAPETLGILETLAAGRPLHIHLAEQPAEVEEVIAIHGARPGEWLADRVTLSPQWCLIHSTQLTGHEVSRLAGSGAVAGLCPITEQSLGDGIFAGRAWMDAGGAIAIGSDSNIRIALAEELRSLEYSQRLRDHARAVLASQTHSTARYLYQAVTAGGACASQRNSGAIAAGFLADIVSLDSRAIAFHGREGDQLLDSFVFTADDRVISDVWSAGRHCVHQGRHHDHGQITRRYRAVLDQLGAVL